MKLLPREARIAIIGLGYVGLPLAVAFADRHPTTGFDINAGRIDSLRGGFDATGEVSEAELAACDMLSFSSDIDDLKACNVYIVAVPTPIDAHHQPDLRPLIGASEMIGKVISEGDVVVYESTVYPGATEDDCIPVVERVSGLMLNRDFFAGYSPERINPGDRDRPVTKIIKVTSGSTPEAADFVDALYAGVITAGTHKASSIKVAEASKIIENTQRDVSIALVNELSIIFSHLGIDTSDVLNAAATKWNFHRYTPGLVGGHCIGVDPYYLVHKSVAAGHIPDIIRTSREINDGMARNAVSRLLKVMIRNGLTIRDARVLVLGVTFKEDCPDIRNTKIVDLVAHMRDFQMSVEVHDPIASIAEVRGELGLDLLERLPSTAGDYDVVVLAVPHRDTIAGGAGRLRTLLRPDGVLFDMKAVFAGEDSDLRL